MKKVFLFIIVFIPLLSSCNYHICKEGEMDLVGVRCMDDTDIMTSDPYNVNVCDGHGGTSNWLCAH